MNALLLHPSTLKRLKIDLTKTLRLHNIGVCKIWKEIKVMTPSPPPPPSIGELSNLNRWARLFLLFRSFAYTMHAFTLLFYEKEGLKK